MKKIYLIILVTLLGYTSSTSRAAGDNHPIGARSAGLGGAGLTLNSVFAAHHNQAALAYLPGTAFGLYSENRFFMEGLNLFGLAAAHPFSGGTVGMQATYFGYNAYRETKLGLNFARRFGNNFAAGIQFDYLGLSIAEYGSAASFTVEAGILYVLSHKFTVGAHVFNPVNHTSGEEMEVPTIFSLGASYKPSEKVLIVVEAEKDIDHKPVIRGGLEYRLNDYLHLRGGTATNPAVFTFGTGIFVQDLVIDLAFTYHQVLGFTPQVGISYQIQNKKLKVPYLDTF